MERAADRGLCGSCRFWRFRRDQGGECFRYPPQLVATATDPNNPNLREISGLRPWMERTEFCGEWKAR